MDAKDLMTESSMSERSNDGNAKYTQRSTELQCNRKNPYQDIGSNSLGKVEVQTTRPCAVIGPDRIVPPPVSTDAYLKKTPTDSWVGDNIYRQPPEYPHKMSDYHLPTRNISPRQTFQENMQRIMVPPSYNATKLKEDHNFPVDANVSSLRNTKTNVALEAKYCDVPYTVNPLSSDQKILRNPDVSNMNAALPRNVPQVWPPGSATIRPSKPYGAPEIYPYMEYPSCSGPRAMVMSRSQRTIHEDPPVYSDPFYHESNLRFKPYPPVKERYPHARYDYVSNYSAPFHPPPHLPPHKYDLQKTIPSHTYTGYPQVPLKYIDSRIPEQFLNGYQRPLNPQHSFNSVPFHNQVMHPGYGPVANNCLQKNKYFPYPTDSSVKQMTTNKLTYDAAHKMYAEYDTRVKPYGMPENYYVNEMGRQVMKGQVLTPNYPSVNIHPLPHHPYYRKENISFKQYEYNQQFRNIDQPININGATLSRLPPQFSPGNIAISPSDSNTSNDTSHTQGTLPEDCGYVSQSSTASIRSMESGITRIPSDPYKRFDYRYGPMARNSPLSSKLETNLRNKTGIDLRQFIQMWNEGEEDNSENTTTDVALKSANSNEITNHFENSNQEQLYVLGLVNVPSEELSKYEHIQKVSKLPENIKGYNSIELLNQFEEAIESSNLNHCHYKPLTSRNYVPLKRQATMHALSVPSRPLSPLDVEAKISQSVIHKEVGCNFEIKPCSPKMLNVDVPTPVQLLNERSIEKISNHVMIPNSQVQNVSDNTINCTVVNHQDHRISNDHTKVSSCKMANSKYDSINTKKTDYNLQDLESSSGVCLASLPRLDNDIELNFPEINQQFINANKVESVIITTPKDLPALDLDQHTMDEVFKEKKVEENLECEKVPTKLSKYRKQKRKGSESTEHQSEQIAQVLRTDSVIIKNPENKNHEDNFKDFTNSTAEVCPKTDSINLTIQSVNTNKIEIGQNNGYDTSNDLAINFTLDPNVDNVSNLTDPDKTIFSSPPSFNKSSSLAMDTKIKSDAITDNSIFSFNNSDVDFTSSTNTCEITHMEERISKDILKELAEDVNISLHQSIPNEIEGNKILSVKTMIDAAGKNEPQSNQISKQMPEVTSDLKKIYKEDTFLRQEIQTEETQNMLQDFDKYNVDCNKTSLKNYFRIGKELFSPYVQNLALFPEGLCSNSAQDFDVKLKHNKSDESLSVLDINNKCEPEETSSKENEKTAIVYDSEIDEKHTVTESLSVLDLNNRYELQNICKKEIENEKTVNHDYDIYEKDTINDESLGVIDINNKYEPLKSNYKDNENAVIFDSQTDEKAIITDESLCVLDIFNKFGVEKTSRKKIENEKAAIPDTEIDKKDATIKSDNSFSVYDNINSEYEPQETTRKEMISERVILNDSNINEKDTRTKTIDCLSIFDINNKYEPQETSKKEIESLKSIIHQGFDESLSVLNINNKNEQEDTSRKDIENEKAVVYDPDINEQNTSTTTYDTLSVLDLNNKQEQPKTSKEIENENLVIVHDSVVDEKDTSTKNEDYLKFSDLNNKYQPHESTKEENQNEKAANNVDEIDTSIKTKTYDPEDTSSEESVKAIAVQGSQIDKKNTSSDNKELYCGDTKRSNTKVLVDYSDYEDDNTEDDTSATEEENSRQVFSNDNQYNTNNLAHQKISFTNTSLDCTENIDSINELKTIDENYNATSVVEDNTYDSSRDLYVNDVGKENSADFIKGKPCSDMRTNIEKNITSEFVNLPVNPKLAEINIDNNTSVNELEKQNDGSKSKKSNATSCISSLIYYEEKNNFTQTLNEVSSDEKSSNEHHRESVGDFTQNVIKTEDFDLTYMDANESQKKEFATQNKNELAKPDIIVDQTLTKNIFFQMKISKEIFPEENVKRKYSLKRSLSDSALNLHSLISRTDGGQDFIADESLWPAKRKRLNFQNLDKPELVANNYVNRRNSISSFYNEDNVSFCILIDNDCIITEDESVEDETHEKISYTDDYIPEDRIPCVETDDTIDYTRIENEDVVLGSTEYHSDSNYKCYVLDSGKEQQSFEEVWVEDVACVETVVSDDVAEDVELSALSSPKSIDTNCEESNNNETQLFEVNNHSDKVKYIYGNEMNSTDAELVETLYRTPQMDVTALINREPNCIDDGTTCYDNESLEDILSDYNNDTFKKTNYELSKKCSTSMSPTPLQIFNSHLENITLVEKSLMSDSESLKNSMANSQLLSQGDTVHSCESSCDNVFSYEENTNNTISSSPEVSSTTSEEKNSGILLKITNYGGSRIAQINETHSNKKHNTVSCKYTETKDYISSDKKLTVRTLITKAAQKYIPPLKETIRDLKVKLPLPPQSLMKLKQLKLSKEKPKPNVNKNKCNILRNEIPKKSKPKFEDVLKSIDEINFKNHKEKSKKIKKYIPKVVIKKNENGSHYASTSNVDKFNPDLTGMKWQPWVFLDKNHFIDKMALKNKTRAIFSHRKNTYVLAESFKKYKSVSSNTRFVISQPHINESSRGKLKYTITLKHSY